MMILIVIQNKTQQFQLVLQDTQYILMEMMLLEAIQGTVLRIEAEGLDARTAVDALAALVEAGFSCEPPSETHPDTDETQP